MRQLIKILEDMATGAILASFGESGVAPELLRAQIAPSSDFKHGHYQCNSAMQLARHLGLPPRKIAEQIVSSLPPASQKVLAKTEIAGPGFINFTFENAFLGSLLDQQLADTRQGVALPARKEKVIVELSSPNVAKELHVGHLRSTIIGDSLARLFEFLEHDVLRLNHIGDWGTQFGMLIAYMKEEQPDVLNGKVISDLPSLMGSYRASKKRFDEDLAFKERAKSEVVCLQGGDSTSLHAWKMICDISRRAYGEIYALLDVSLQERGESFYNTYLSEVVEELKSKEMITESEGALCVFLDGFIGQEGNPLPMIIRKSDGGFNYSTTDMAALRHRVSIEKADQILMVVDSGQQVHFQMILKAAEKAGYYDPKKTRIEHVGFGLVLGADGKKFKTRSGDTERLIDLLTESIQKASEVIMEKEGVAELTEDMRARATILGIDAVKYADLSNERIKDYKFSYERMLQFEGNTAAFLLYSYVRMGSIQSKATRAPGPTQIAHETEVKLALHLLQFPEIIDTVAKKLMPNLLCNYLYELASYFNDFYRDCKIIESPARLSICAATRNVLARGLDLLGLKRIEKM